MCDIEKYNNNSIIIENKIKEKDNKINNLEDNLEDKLDILLSF